MADLGRVPHTQGYYSRRTLWRNLFRLMWIHKQFFSLWYGVRSRTPIISWYISLEAPQIAQGRVPYYECQIIRLVRWTRTILEWLYPSEHDEFKKTGLRALWYHRTALIIIMGFCTASLGSRVQCEFWRLPLILTKPLHWVIQAISKMVSRAKFPRMEVGISLIHDQPL